MSYVFHFAARTDAGPNRDINEDSGYATSRLLAVADGVGGAAFGEVASSIAICTVREWNDGGRLGSPADLELAAREANSRIAARIRADPETQGMGTTFTSLLLYGENKLGLVHIGDSRAYMWRNGDLLPLSRDHTLMRNLIDAGTITPAQAKRHPLRSVITNAMDGHQEPKADVQTCAIEPGDLVLVCSDGLTDVVPDKVLGRAFAASADPADAVANFVRLALEAGGPDNVTCLVAQVVADGAPQDPVLLGAVTENASAA